VSGCQSFIRFTGLIASLQPARERLGRADCSGQPCWQMNDSRRRLSTVKFMGDPGASSGGPLQALP